MKETASFAPNTNLLMFPDRLRASGLSMIVAICDYFTPKSMGIGWSDKGQLPGHGLEPHGQGTVLRIGRPGCGATAIELHGISGLMVFPALHVLVCSNRSVSAMAVDTGS